MFTGETWDEFLAHGADVSGFTERRKNLCNEVQPGDYFICYLTGLSRFVGVLEVQSKCYYDTSPIWQKGTFPVRFKVKPVITLTPETAVPVLELRDKLSIFKKILPGGRWSGFFRGSPAKFDPQDAQVVIQAIEDAARNPVKRDFDRKKYFAQHTKYGAILKPSHKLVRESRAQPVLEEGTQEEASVKGREISHEEMQYLLLKLGADMGLDVWVARNDRGKVFNGQPFANIPNLLGQLPAQFDRKTMNIIENIDVIWLRGGTFVAAFEVEHTTQIYSGLLRLSDLVAKHPNLKIELYIVAPDERKDKVAQEVGRPTFENLQPPLRDICRFLPYSKLKNEVTRLGSTIRYLPPKYVHDEIAEAL